MSQVGFAEALLDPGLPVPEGIVDPWGQPAPRRFSVYRNNVVSSLVAALEAGFPTVVKLVGQDFFRAMAAEFVRAQPPKSRILMLYGAEFPGFLERFGPVAHLGYLPDIARLDQAMRESYHAADSAPLKEAEFQALIGGDLAGLRLRLSPALRLVGSAWPVHAIWRANHEGGPNPKAEAQEVLVTRPEFDPCPRLLPKGGGAFIRALMEGARFDKALDLAGPEFDLFAALSLLVQDRAIIGVLE